MKLFGREQGSMAVKMDLSVDSNIALTRWRGRDEKNFILLFGSCEIRCPFR